MKQITEKEKHYAANAFGQYGYSFRQKFEIETTDAGRLLGNYRGYKYSEHKFSHSDVGKVITVYTDGTGWDCWTFD